MRISDWSSDVCSSDLVGDAADRVAHVVGRSLDVAVEGELHVHRRAPVAAARLDDLDALDARQRVFEHLGDAGLDHRRRGAGVVDVDRDDRRRSEEHTSELQSLMRISYAVFCLKKKKRPTQTTKS